MPVSELLVEGELDATLLNAVLRGKPAVRSGGSKNALKPKVVEDRRRNKLSTASYIRDRDFDIDPPAVRVQPQVHERDAKGQVLGWFWCRHEMENYLLEPGLVARALNEDVGLYLSRLLIVACQIIAYQAARAAIGVVRRSLPPSYELRTRPVEFKDDALVLPGDLSAETLSAWACDQADRFRARICPQLEPKAIMEEVERRTKLLARAQQESPTEILVWFAGKDLLAGLARPEWLAPRRLVNAGEMRARLRNWVRDNPDEALDLLPEWKNFVTILNAD